MDSSINALDSASEQNFENAFFHEKIVHFVMLNEGDVPNINFSACWNRHRILKFKIRGSHAYVYASVHSTLRNTVVNS